MGVSPSTVRRWNDGGRLPFYLGPSGTHRRIQRADLRHFMLTNGMEDLWLEYHREELDPPQAETAVTDACTAADNCASVEITYSNHRLTNGMESLRRTLEESDPPQAETAATEACTAADNAVSPAFTEHPSVEVTYRNHRTGARTVAELRGDDMREVYMAAEETLAFFTRPDYTPPSFQMTNNAQDATHNTRFTRRGTGTWVARIVSGHRRMSAAGLAAIVAATDVRQRQISRPNDDYTADDLELRGFSEGVPS